MKRMNDGANKRYFMGQFEFRQYVNAATRLEAIKQRHEQELQDAYDGIHPTRVCYDYEKGEFFSESLNVADYAIWLVDLKSDQEEQQEYWNVRAEAFECAKEGLSKREQQSLRDTDGVMINDMIIMRKVKKELEKIVASKPKLQRRRRKNKGCSIEEWDKEVEKMNDDELLSDYVDVIGD